MPTRTRLVKARHPATTDSASNLEVPHLLDPTYSGASSSSPPKFSYNKVYVDAQGLEHDPDYKPFAVTTTSRTGRRAGNHRHQHRARSGSRVSQIGLVRPMSWDTFSDVTDDDDIEEEDDDELYSCEEDEQDLRQMLQQRYGTSSLVSVPQHLITAAATVDQPTRRRRSGSSLYPSTPAQQQHEVQHHSRTASPALFDHSILRSSSPLTVLSSPPSPHPPSLPLRQEFSSIEEKDRDLFEKKRSHFSSWRNSFTASTTSTPPPVPNPAPGMVAEIVVTDLAGGAAGKEARSSTYNTHITTERIQPVHALVGNDVDEYVPSKQAHGRRIALPEGEDDDDHAWTPSCGEAIRRQFQSIALSFRFATFRTKRRLKRRVESLGR